MTKHLIIPDVQAKPDVPFDHLEWIGNYIVEKKPDVIVNIGDFADMPSLSSYDRGKKSFEGRRYKHDIDATKEAMDILLGPMREYNAKQRRTRHAQYKPRMILTLGNHEQRIERATECQPELDGVVGYHDLPYEDWEVYDFLEPVFVDGICYSHYMANPMTGKPIGSMASTRLKTVGHSFVMGHQQTLDVATRQLGNGQQQWAIIAGACYLHDENYKGHQGNKHWRGIVMLHNVDDGDCNPMFISLDYLRTRYESS